ncbi:VacB/RNase II family 3'-5' exoribonuclease [Simiduia curdlanivorans]|uniref:exoribonuclease II n=1 Tax=Simiduia curdlanivorans TaxID=1492769 RepID=A0ABV8UZI2_9GAMM|nr:VacB/RNase II family 3'-5' exoribonuclease [Simiduia curdlanivorans]MDN3639219.1 VacB/RNase II family 3'-5' exoribonuclease [Simiduia curdlanivorans]
MLDISALQQLSQLKQTIRDNRDIATGTVRGTQSRFGFLHLDDGRDAFLAPEQMDRVLPGDRVEALISEVNDGKQSGKFEASLEKLIESPLTQFVGKYVVRGQGHFVAPDLPQLSRWIFLPPKARKHAAPGDYLLCSIQQHPFHSQGKAQASIDINLGSDSSAGIETKYMCAKFDIPFNATQLHTENNLEAQRIHQAFTNTKADDEGWTDLTELHFVTIDSANTQDMDDAIHIDNADNGETIIRVAIAQPSSLIPDTSNILTTAHQLANTLYFPGNHQMMLPEILSHQSLSLMEGAVRRALVVQMQFDPTGAMGEVTFERANIQSKGRLNYQQVANYLLGTKDALSPDHHACIDALFQWSAIRREWRAVNTLIMDDRPDYEFELTEAQKIAKIHILARTQAHQIVEEAMLAANIAAGELFAREKLPGIYSTHAGPKPERLETLQQMLAGQPEAALDPTTLEGYLALVKGLESRGEQRLLSNFRRQLQPGQLRFEAEPHLGLGFKHYATITSPIRRYHDLHNQQVICAWLANQNCSSASTELAAELQLAISKGRQAVKQAESWLVCQYLQNFIGQTFSGQISMVNSAGVGVRLDANGAEGFVLVRNRECKPAFDPIALTLTLNDAEGAETVLHLDANVTVKLDSIESDTRKLHFSLVS